MFVTNTSCALGEIKTKLSGFAILNINDSTLNCEPRLRTEKKSTPKTRANSLEMCQHTPNRSHYTHAVFVTVSVASRSSKLARVRIIRKLTRCMTCAVASPLYHWVKVLKVYLGTLGMVREYIYMGKRYSPTLENVEDYIFKSVYRQGLFRPHDPPEIEDMSP